MWVWYSRASSVSRRTGGFGWASKGWPVIRSTAARASAAGGPVEAAVRAVTARRSPSRPSARAAEPAVVGSGASSAAISAGTAEVSSLPRFFTRVARSSAEVAASVIRLRIGGTAYDPASRRWSTA
ncbi:MAG: hypothetical protein U0835_13195 [Isosphaeraceae bacterium]